VIMQWGKGREGRKMENQGREVRRSRRWWKGGRVRFQIQLLDQPLVA